jgi:hypothetical protein
MIKFYNPKLAQELGLNDKSILQKKNDDNENKAEKEEDIKD